MATDDSLIPTLIEPELSDIADMSGKEASDTAQQDPWGFAKMLWSDIKAFWSGFDWSETGIAQGDLTPVTNPLGPGEEYRAPNFIQAVLDAYTDTGDDMAVTEDGFLTRPDDQINLSRGAVEQAAAALGMTVEEYKAALSGVLADNDVNEDGEPSNDTMSVGAGMSPVAVGAGIVGVAVLGTLAYKAIK